MRITSKMNNFPAFQNLSICQYCLMSTELPIENLKEFTNLFYLKSAEVDS